MSAEIMSEPDEKRADEKMAGGWHSLSIQELLDLYAPVKEQIEARLEEFGHIWETASDEDLFRELVFCLLTPQSKARVCWRAVQRLERRCLISSGEPCQLQEELVGVRFNRRKAEYICLARSMFCHQSLRSTLEMFSSPAAAREWLVENVKGLGYKEASHFLRNIGLGEELAILDRHILKNLLLLGVIAELPRSPTKRLYLEIEKEMAAFSSRTEIPMGQLDLLLWYKEAGEVFK
ncbi:N-glycosylase/DNA lyase [Methanothrix sp.]|uniref:N-glycosylase/DNA lyase n=1 Tax=Methanothrix sp. TaxID=90426 RepID=UPI0025D5C8A3|nr:N-glycosylase/DNA lyase [Methanothrix sp.]